MQHGRWLLPAALLAVLVAAGRPAAAENPRISLKLDNVTGREAIAALAAAAGVRIGLWSGAPRLGAAVQPPGARPEVGTSLDERASFDWQDGTLSQALRQLCERYRLRPQREVGGGYVLNPAPPAPEAPAPKLVGAFEKQGIQLSVSQIWLSENRSRQVDFVADRRDSNGSSNLTLTIHGLSPDIDCETIAGFDRVVARDDAGSILQSMRRSGDLLGRGINTGNFPDEWSHTISLPGAHPRARKLLWVEGDLLVYRQFRRYAVEFPVGGAGPWPPRGVADAVVQMTAYDPGDGLDAGPRVAIQATMPRGSGVGLDSGGSLPVRLIGASGKSYASNGGSYGSGGGPEGARATASAQFPVLPEPVVKAVVDLVERGRPEKLLSFRLADIPLPPDEPFAPPPVARNPVVSPSPLGPGDVQRPFYERGGSALALAVQILGKPAGEGSLQLGLAAKAGSDWGPLRWFDLLVDGGGRAHLDDLKPGTYRMLRSYRPKTALRLPGPGRWTGEEITVEVAPGKQMSPPPLTWSADSPPAAPAAARAPVVEKGRPAAGKR